eukprot:c20504_g2_i2.p1 GENE.c20504_g2_i2~~c20504_g2_i2.p1  ORF type:complete len:107 (-),score=27.91 c20504_g2_i2:18-338(-)
MGYSSLFCVLLVAITILFTTTKAINENNKNSNNNNINSDNDNVVKINSNSLDISQNKNVDHKPNNLKPHGSTRPLALYPTMPVQLKPGTGPMFSLVIALALMANDP